jgi:hypothetical protein
MGGISYNMWLRGLCAGLSWFLRLYFLAELGSTTDGTTTLGSEGSKRLRFPDFKTVGT